MCGITGIFHLDGQAVDQQRLLRMTRLIRHRGPDDEGYLLVNTRENKFQSCHHDETVPEIKASSKHLADTGFQADLAFGFRRLSIIDLSPAGHQPMGDPETGNWIVFNGEIYNYIEIREELRKLGHPFRTQSDTEVILKSYLQWGADCVQRFNGMWAFAVWDAKNKKLFCSRDRFGIKPFYYCFVPGQIFAFASEIKSLLEITSPKMDYRAMAEYLEWGNHDHSDFTFFAGIRQLPPSHSLTLANGELSIKRYYELKPQKEATHDDKWYADAFRNQFFDAVKLRLRSDVPVGYALSGGVDSSSIVVAAHHINHGSDNAAFSTVYPNSTVDESAYINSVIEKTKFRQYSVSPEGEQLAKEMDAFVWHQEEPVSGLSYYAEFCLRRLIREKGVIVSLEGQGADEIISGYTNLINPYLQDLLRERRWNDFYKEYLRFKVAAQLTSLVVFADILSVMAPRLQTKLRQRYRRSASGELKDAFIAEHGGMNRCDTVSQSFDSRLNQTLYRYLTCSYVPPQLVRADKSSMAFSVECRFPFLDYRLVEFAFSVPGKLKIRDGVTKFILREAMKEYLPEKVYNRRDKLGFPTPQESWLRNELRPLMDDVVNSQGFRELPFINFNEFKVKYSQFMKAGGTFHDQLWKLTGIYIWLKRFNITA